MNNCKVCNLPMKLIPAGNARATGIPYNAFFACPSKCKQPRVQFRSTPNTSQDPIASGNKQDDIMLVLEECQSINKRLNQMAEFLVSKLGTDKKEEVDIKDIKF